MEKLYVIPTWWPRAEHLVVQEHLKAGWIGGQPGGVVQVAPDPRLLWEVVSVCVDQFQVQNFSDF
jgi:hypothetical protein